MEKGVLKRIVEDNDLVIVYSCHSFDWTALLNVVYFNFPIGKIAYQHHERLGNSDDAQGLKGDEVKTAGGML